MLQSNTNPKYLVGNLIQEKSYVSMLKIESSNFLMIYLHHQLMTHPHLMVDGAYIM
jgi:hypothetical protein